MKGSMTVEAALIIPFIFCIVMALLWLNFFMYDEVAFRCDEDRYLCAYENAIRDGTGEEVDARDYLTGYFLAGTQIVEEPEADEDTLTLKAELHMDFAGSYVPVFLRDLFGATDGERKRAVDKRVEYARYIRAARKLVADIKDISGL